MSSEIEEFCLSPLFKFEIGNSGVKYLRVFPLSMVEFFCSTCDFEFIVFVRFESVHSDVLLFSTAHMSLIVSSGIHAVFIFLQIVKSIVLINHRFAKNHKFKSAACKVFHGFVGFTFTDFTAFLETLLIVRIHNTDLATDFTLCNHVWLTGEVRVNLVVFHIVRFFNTYRKVFKEDIVVKSITKEEVALVTALK